MNTANRWHPRGWQCVLGAASALLLLLAVVLTVSTERQLMADQTAADAAVKAPVLSGPLSATSAALNGMTRVSGPLTVAQAARDPDFNQQASAPALIRHVEMFQWQELGAAGQPRYQLGWVDHPVDSHRFAIPGGHANPDRFPFDGRRFEAGGVELQGLLLSPPLAQALPGRASLPPQFASLPPNLAATFTLDQNALVTSSRVDSPQLGDLRVSWEVVPAQSVTVIARREGQQLLPGPPGANGRGFEIQPGEASPSPAQPAPLPVSNHAWSRRLLTMWLAMLGAGLGLYAVRQRHDAGLAMALGVLLVAAIAAALWFGNRPALAAGWLSVALGALAVAAWRWRRARVLD